MRQPYNEPRQSAELLRTISSYHAEHNQRLANVLSLMTAGRYARTVRRDMSI